MLTLRAEDIAAYGDALVIRTREAARILSEVESGKEYDLTLKRHAERRSRNANNFMWSILDQCADILGTTKEALYMEYIRKVGMYKEFNLTEDEARTFCVAWGKIGLGWQTEQADFTANGVTIHAYYGSSTYSKKRMSRLLDMIVEDAKEIGVDCLTEKERALLLDKWEPVKI